MPAISLKQLLEAGVHFGHQTRRWNPKMAQYIFTERNGIYIIDLQKTARKADEAYNFVRDLSMAGKDILFVGTKKQTQEIIAFEAQRCNMHFVNKRWLGGTLTNFRTIRSRVQRLEQIEVMEREGALGSLPKKEILRISHEREKLEANLCGIREMKKLPDALFVVDTRKEHIAIAEARALNIPIVAIVDTNCDPDEIDYPIPGNDDAARAVKLIVSKFADAIIEGREKASAEWSENGVILGSNKHNILGKIQTAASAKAGGGVFPPPKPRIIPDSQPKPETPDQKEKSTKALMMSE